MTPRPTRALLAAGLAAALAASAFATAAQADTTIPGLNGKILFTSTRDFPIQPSDAAGRGAAPTTCYSGNECSDELYSMNADGSAQTRLTNNQSDDDNGAWLPADGSQIAFDSDRVQTGEDCTSDCDYNIWSMAGDGSSPIELTHDAGDELDPSYSPDGSRIAFSGNNPDVSLGSADRLLISGTSEIFTMPSSGEGATGATPLLPASQTGELDPGTYAFDAYPAWSPDGSEIAFTRLTITEDLSTFDIRTYVAPANGAGPATEVESYPLCAEPQESPSDMRALSGAMLSGNVRSVRSALQARLIPVSSCVFDLDPVWSPDGSRIAVTRVITGQPPASPDRLISPTGDPGDIVVIPLADPSSETDLSNVTEPADCNSTVDAPACSYDEDPAWSPDGTKIAFDSDRQADGTEAQSCIDDTPSCPDDIWVMNADGTSVTQLTSNSDENFDPDWQRIPPPPPPPAPVVPAAPPAPPAAPAKAPKIGVAGVRRACVRGSFHVRFRIATTSSVKKVVVRLDGHRIKSTKRGGFTLRINGHRLKAGRHRLTITATNAAGKRTTAHRSFSVCRAAKKRHRAAPRFTG